MRSTPDSLSIEVRPVAFQDRSAFVRFVTDLSAEGHRFLKEHLDPSDDTFERMLQPPARRLVAIEPDGTIIGLAGAFPGTGWSSHVAELRIVVASSWRGRGVGRALAKASLLEALHLGCTHSYVEVVAEQEALVDMFQDMGFEPEALLVDFVRDEAAQFHDLLLLTQRVDGARHVSSILQVEESLR